MLNGEIMNSDSGATKTQALIAGGALFAAIVGGGAGV